jgi:hypothetical protein
MIDLNDEILNKYLDGELEQSDFIRVQELLKASADARSRLGALQTVHSGLKQMKEYSPSEEFTSLVMGKLFTKVESKKGQKVFIYSISGFFIVLSLVISGIALSIILNSAAASSSGEFSQNISSYTSKITEVIRDLFSDSGISIFGSILSLGIIIFSYFFFEFQKNLKTKTK